MKDTKSSRMYMSAWGKEYRGKIVRERKLTSVLPAQTVPLCSPARQMQIMHLLFTVVSGSTAKLKAALGSRGFLSRLKQRVTCTKKHSSL